VLILNNVNTYLVGITGDVHYKLGLFLLMLILHVYKTFQKKKSYKNGKDDNQQ